MHSQVGAIQANIADCQSEIERVREAFTTPGRRLVWDRINVVHAVEEQESDYAAATVEAREQAKDNASECRRTSTYR